MIRAIIRKVRVFFRDAINGRFVTKLYADEHKDTTTREER